MTSFPYDLLFAWVPHIVRLMHVHVHMFIRLTNKNLANQHVFPLTELSINLSIEHGFTDVSRSHPQLCPVINMCVLHGLSLLKGSVMYRTILSSTPTRPDNNCLGGRGEIASLEHIVTNRDV